MKVCALSKLTVGIPSLNEISLNMHNTNQNNICLIVSIAMIIVHPIFYCYSSSIKVDYDKIIVAYLLCCLSAGDKRGHH